MSTFAATDSITRTLSRLRGHHVSRRLAAILVSLLIVTAVDSSALASCGDYVAIHGRSAAMSQHSLSRNFDADQSSPQKSSVPPCHGPACRGQDPMPSAPPAIPNGLTNGQQDVAMLLTSASVAADSCGDRLQVTAIAACDGHHQRLRRPPRS
jgi:hypothetical protein